MSDILAGLTNESKGILEAYLNWSKLRHDKFSRDLEFEAKSFRDDSLLQQTYSQTEVATLLDNQFRLIQHSLEKNDQFIRSSSAELCRNILTEADKHRLHLHLNAVECLQNATAVSAMEQHESRLMGGPKGKLAPLTTVETGGEAGKQLAEANDVIRHLNEKLRRITEEYTKVMNEKSAQTQKVLQAQDDVKGTAETAQLRLQLEMAQKDLHAKVNATPQFIQLKKLLDQKNTQVKSLRERLANFDPSFAGQEPHTEE